MRSSELLTKIWRDEVYAATDATSMQALGAFGECIRVPAVCLRVRKAEFAPMVLADDTELMAGLPLGDVLAEELSLEIPFGSLILLLPQCDPQDISHSVGELVAEAAHLAVLSGQLPLDVHTDALYLAAQSAHALASSPEFLQHGMDRRRFIAGLSARFGKIWKLDASRPCKRAPSIDHEDFLSSRGLITHLSRLDAFFTAPDPQCQPADMLRASRKDTLLGPWVSKLESALRVALGLPAALTQLPDIFAVAPLRQ